MRSKFLILSLLTATLVLSSCGRLGFGGFSRAQDNGDSDAPVATNSDEPPRDEAGAGESIWLLFRPPQTENTVSVNKYIWKASLEVLDFLPIQSVDPFTGVIVTGYGTPPGGGRSYRATVLVDDPALDARSLNVALQTRGGTANPATVRAIEDAILTRARQLRVADNRL